MSKPDTWTVPADLADDVDQYAQETRLPRSKAIEELVRLGLMADGQTHAAHRFHQQRKSAK